MQIAAGALVKPFTAQINQIKKELGSNKGDITVQIIPTGLEDLNNNVNSIDLIQARLNKWDLRIDAHKVYADMLKAGDIRHGVISFLAVLYIIDIMYQKYNPGRVYKNVLSPRRSSNFNQKYFEGDVVSACSAIFIHDLPNTYFAQRRIDRIKAPVAFLLRLSDALQQWERPSLRNQNGYASKNFEITIKGKKLVFKADILKKEKERMKNEVSSLDAVDVEIL